jgi:hypothetical protein
MQNLDCGLTLIPMVPAPFFPQRRRSRPRLFFAVMGAFVLSAVSLVADATDTPGSPSDAASYLAQHQADLAPFFNQNGPVLIKDALPLFVDVTGHIMLFTSLVACLLDVLLAWIFSTIAAPAYAKVTRALVYATGRLALALALTILLSVATLLTAHEGIEWLVLLVVGLLAMLAVVIQIFWVIWLYRTSARDAVLFYIVLLLVHLILGAILIPVFFSNLVDGSVAHFVDDSITPQLRLDAITARHDIAGILARRDAEQAKVAALQAQLAQDKTDEANLQQAIRNGKSLPAFAFSRLVLMRAQGNLTQAATGFAAFIASHPHDPETNAARGQLAEINQEVSVQLAAQRQEQAMTARANAQAQARLLAKAAVGQATLSEMRAALLGKTPAQVYAIFGEPSERGADRWGYAKRMLIDPQSSQARGLTIDFSDGLVQGVDYYYGSGP